MTKKKTRLRSRLADFFIVVLSLCVSFYFVRLFWLDLNSATVRTDTKSIATIVFKQRIAQRKFSDRVVWERLQNNSPLYNADTLRTSAQSEAYVIFDNGTIIEMHENTMLQIFYTEDGIKLTVDEGDIDLDTSSVNSDSAEGSSVLLQMNNGAQISVQSGSKLSASSNTESGIINFNLQEGKGSVIRENGESVDLQKGQIVKVEKSGEVTKGDFSVTSISNNLRILNFQDTQAVPVQFEWSSNEELKSKLVIIEVSSKKDFSVVEKSYRIEDQNNFTLPADDGVMYWRAYIDDSDTVEVTEEIIEEKRSSAVVGKIRVDNVTPVSLTSPVDGASYTYRKQTPKINFNWQGDSLATKYKIEIATTPDFSLPVISQELAAKSAVYSTLGQGTYYWRVTPYYAVNNTGYSDASKMGVFTVVQNEAVTPPVLSVPAQNATLTYQVKDFNLSFIWKSNVDDADYSILISKDEAFSNVVYSSTVSEKRIFRNFAEELPVGNYFWKIVRQSAEDEGTSESEVRQFSVIKYVPGQNRLLYPPNNYSVENVKMANTSFMWKLADEYKNSNAESILQISATSDFKQILTEVKTKSQELSNIKLKDGKYYWRIGVYNSYEDKTDYTQPRFFNVVGELSSPKITAPLNGNLLVAMPKTPLNLTWDAVEDADLYKVTIYDTQASKVIYEKSVKTTAVYDFLVPDDVGKEKSDFRLLVQPFTEQTDIAAMRSGKASSVEFAVRSPSPVKLVSPQNGGRIDGLSALRKPVVLEWASDADKVTKATVVLNRVMPNGTIREVDRVENGKTTASFTRLKSGTYQWTVYASSADGNPLDADSVNTFTVTSVPPLGLPSLTEPKQNTVIGPEYLRKNRNLNFSWNAVAGATDYTFNLYLRRGDGTLKRVYSEKNIKSTSYKFKKLDILDVGNFEWDVTAYAHAKDGFEEQSSSAATGKFKIQFDLPQEVQTIDPGRVYGE